MPRVILKPPAENLHDVQRIPSSIAASRSISGEKPEASKPPYRAASMKYKEKFNAMRQKYEQVTARHEDFQRQLDVANAKMKKLQTENELLLDVIASGATNVYPYPPLPSHISTPIEPNQPYFHQPHPYPNPPNIPLYSSQRIHETAPSYQQGQPPPLPLQPNSHHPHSHPHPHPHPQSHPQPPPPPLSLLQPQSHHRSPHLMQPNGGGGERRNGYPSSNTGSTSISTSHTRTMPMESHERELVGPAPLPPPLGQRAPTPPLSSLRPPSTEYHEANGRHT
ncbi:hypothetical protein APHAL10511_000605 [Amanita phalloides]|nr:hypothetical protein APHAL10511_000605 [Amanita phalloides]